MKHVSIMGPSGHTSFSNIDGTLQIFAEVNVFCESAGRSPVFKIQIVGLSSDIRQHIVH